jgi:hypothetical protein
MARRRRTAWRSSAALLALAAGVAAVLYMELADSVGWLIGGEDPPLPAAAATGARDGAGPNAALQRAQRSLPPPDAYAEITERPLFMETRRPVPVADAAVETARKPVAVPALVVHGILVSDARRMALMKTPSDNRLVQVSPGQQLEGWEVSAIEPDRVVITNGEDTAEFFLDDALMGAGGRAPRSTRRR